MQVHIRRLTQLAYSGRRSPILALRRRRMAEFVRRVAPTPGARILDLGGSPEIWRLLPERYDVTLVNLPGGMDKLAGALVDGRRDFRVVLADACDLRDLFDDDAFDVVFSNSVIEHVGDAARRRAFAREVRRLAPAYWVQTPSPRFPIEPHTGVPYFFSLPASVRRRMIESWRRTLPLYAEMVDGTTVVHAEEMAALFPDAEVYRERVLGFEKSYSFYRLARAGGARTMPRPRLSPPMEEGYVRGME